MANLVHVWYGQEETSDWAIVKIDRCVSIIIYIYIGQSHYIDHLLDPCVGGAFCVHISKLDPCLT